MSEIPINQVLHMDAFDMMRAMPDECVQLILTDPPYGIKYQNSFTYNKHAVLAGDDGIDYAEFARQSFRILKNDSHAYFFTRFDCYPYHYMCLQAAGFKIKNCLVIEKGHIGGLGDLAGSYANNSEWVIFCQKGRRAFSATELQKNTYSIHRTGKPEQKPRGAYKTRLNACWFGAEYPKANNNSSWARKHGYRHPTIKNVQCLKWLILLSSALGDIVFDPFMGSGSTAIAALETGRCYSGCEIDPAHYQLCTQRTLGLQGGLNKC